MLVPRTRTRRVSGIPAHAPLLFVGTSAVLPWALTDVPTSRPADRGSGFFRRVDVVPDHAAEDAADGRADQPTLHLVPARGRASDRARRRADRRVTPGVLHDG